MNRSATALNHALCLAASPRAEWAPAPTAESALPAVAAGLGISVEQLRSDLCSSPSFNPEDGQDRREPAHQTVDCTLTGGRCGCRQVAGSAPDRLAGNNEDGAREDRLMRFGTSLALLIVGVVMGCALCAAKDVLVKLLAPLIPGAGH